MQITKLGHCCFLIEERDIKILTDPGILLSAQNEVKTINLILITHEHADHLHLDSVKAILKNNPDVSIITNGSVGKILEKESIKFQTLEHSGTTTFKQILIEAFGSEHAEIYKDFNRVQNTGYFIASKLFYPGDALYIPPKMPEILALPVAGPWIKIKEAVEYGFTVKPKYAFPVHDGAISWTAPFHAVPQKFLSEAGIEFISMLPGDKHNFIC